MRCFQGSTTTTLRKNNIKTGIKAKKLPTVSKQKPISKCIPAIIDRSNTIVLKCFEDEAKVKHKLIILLAQNSPKRVLLSFPTKQTKVKPKQRIFADIIPLLTRHLSTLTLQQKF